jgi:hypothetical protein
MMSCSMFVDEEAIQELKIQGMSYISGCMKRIP